MRLPGFFLALAATGAVAAVAWSGGDRVGDRAAAAIVVVPAPVAPATGAARVLPAAAQPVPAVRAPTAVSWWQPAIGDTWQWQLSGAVSTGYDVAIYDVDLFDTPEATLRALRADGRRIICYFSAGSSETWRADFSQFAKSDMGRPLDGWAGERWLDTRSANVRRIMAARFDRAAQRGCDGVETDNMDGYANRNGLELTAADQLDYNRFLAGEAHARGLAIGLKNDLGQVEALVASFDYAINEQCNQYKECKRLAAFTAAGKPVFNAEYAARYRTNADGARDTLCAAMRAAQIRTLVLHVSLKNKYRHSCDAA